MCTDLGIPKNGASSGRNDDDLLRFYQAFSQVYDEWKRQHALVREYRAFAARKAGSSYDDTRVSSYLPLDSPGPSINEFLEKGRREDAILKEYGFPDIEQRVDELRSRAGHMANRIFATRATSVAGLAVKLKVLRLALGRRGAQEDGDEELEAYQDSAEEFWIDSVNRDAERLVGADASLCRHAALIQDNERKDGRFFGDPANPRPANMDD